MPTPSELGEIAGENIPTPTPATPTLLERVIAVAKSYIGQHEKAGNSGFMDVEFEKKMIAAGWHKGDAWCASFGKLVWKEAFGKDHPLFPLLDKYMTASATSTYNNFRKAKEFKVGQTPKEGALVIWQHGSGWQGHEAIVSAIETPPKFHTIEGNTNEAGQREGVAVLEKTRQTGLPFAANRLNILGFVYLPD